MIKVGRANLFGKDYFITMYTDGVHERVDIITDISKYKLLDTSNCEVSMIFDSVAYFYGEKKLIAEVNKIKSQASTLQYPEQQDIKMENGAVIYIISKKDPQDEREFRKELYNGKISVEYFRTEDGYVEFNSISDSRYNYKDKPLNFDEYSEVGLVTSSGVSTRQHRTTTWYSYEELLQKYPQVMHVLENDYVVVQSYEEAEERLKYWAESKIQLKSFDIESSGTDWGPTSQCRITGVFLGLGTEWSTYFPFRQDNFEYNLPIEFLRRIFDAINSQPPKPEVILLAHNVKFEIQGFYQEYREFVRFDYDTYLLAVLANPKIRKGTHTLKALTNRYEGKFYLSLEDIFIGPVQFNVLPPEIVKLYGCPDATSPAKIFPWLMEQIPKDEGFVVELEQKLPVIKAMNEFYGIRLNQDRLDKLLSNAEEDADNLEKMFQRIHRTTRNINSSDVMRDIMYNQLRCPVEVYTNKGLAATSKVAVSKAIKNGTIKLKDDAVIPENIMSSDGKTVLVEGKDLASNKYPSLIIYQRYKLLLKEVGALRRLKNKSVAGFFKFYINQSGAGSNRQTSDAHQFDDTMKSCAVADSKYHQLVSCDWKQVELRILAGLAEQEDLIELEKDCNVDIHRAILSIIQKKPMYMISEEDRKKGKSVNFGVVYMMTEYGLAARDFGPGYTKDNLNEERKKISDFFNGLPKIKEFIHGNGEFLKQKGYIKSAFNYYRYFPELLDPNIDPKTVKSLVRKGNNTPVQGTGAQMLKIVETKVWNYIRKKGWDKEKDYDGMMLPMVRMIVPIHDEILLSYDKTIPMEEIITMFKECMELEIDGMPPFFAAPAFIDNWYDGKDPVYEVDIPFRDKIVEEYKKGNYLLTGHDYKQTLIDYRNEDIKSYMEGLIAKYHTEEKVAENVKDDNLTHTLIESMIPKKERKKLTHVERIKEAVHRYMSGVDVQAIIEADASDKSEDEELRVAFDDWADEVFEVDANGDIVMPEVDDEDEYYVGSEEEEALKEIKPCRVMYTRQECLVDLTGFGQKEFEELLSLCDEKGYYKLIILQDNKIAPTGYNIGWIEDDIERIFEKEAVTNG